MAVVLEGPSIYETACCSHRVAPSSEGGLATMASHSRALGM